ncbi:MAG: Cna protein B-type domain protein [Microgenomates bacterium OLB23]|nr:MAG: Cna protein B-type domain protein [Microgenomates bacterium OLB23]
MCTFTNTLQTGTLTVIKNVVNDNGGTATASDFTMHVKSNGSDVTGSPAAGSAAGTQYTLNAGTYVVSENAPISGYTQTGFSGDCNSNGSVTLAAGESKTCTITNNDQPATLIIKKVLINDDGGTLVTEDFSFKVNGGASEFFEADGQNDKSVNAGTYTIVEDAATGYTTTYDNCSDVQIPNGGTATCTITNDDNAPTLKLVKVVNNDDGGTTTAGAWVLNATGTGGFSDTGDSTTFHKVKAGVGYVLSESSVAGYAQEGTWTCDKQGVLNGSTATLDLGDEVTCTVTNGDIAPQLIVIKHVINDNGGDALAGDFTMNVTATDPSDASFPGDEQGTTITLKAGQYSVNETELDGYVKTLSADCSGTIQVGETKTCTITNNDEPAHITLIKEIVNPHGGNAEPDDFKLTIGGASVLSGIAKDVDANTPYALDESQLPGYKFVSLEGDEKCPAVLGGEVTLDEGENITCTITNEGIPGRLQIIKNTLGGDDTFNFVVDGIEVPGLETITTSGGTGETSQVDIDAGTHSVAESALAGWDMTNAVCDNGTPENAVVELDTLTTCTFTNAKRGSITIVKDATPNDAQDFDFTGTLGAFTLDDDEGVQDADQPAQYENTKTFSNLVTGESYAINETQPNQYWSLQGVVCVETGTTNEYPATVSATGVSLDLQPGADVTCTFANLKLGATRTQGFWKTHTSYTSGVLAAMGGSIPIGIAPSTKAINGASRLFGAYYANVAKKSNNQKRTPIEQARIQLLHQLVTTKLNCQEFGCPTYIQEQVTLADTYYSTGSIAQILSMANILDQYNNSGDTIIISGTPGKATPKDSQTQADIPYWNSTL